MATEKYKYGKAEHSTEAAHHAEGEEHAIAISNLHVLIVPEGKGYFAQAFEIDYGVQGSSVEEVKKRFEEGLAVTLHHNIDIFGTIRNILRPNPDWYTLKEQTEGSEYDFSCTQWSKVSPIVATDMFKFIEYQSVRAIAA